MRQSVGRVSTTTGSWGDAACARELPLLVNRRQGPRLGSLDLDDPATSCRWVGIWSVPKSFQSPYKRSSKPRSVALRILFTSYPAIGHFHPLAPLGLAARDAGHDVRVVIGPNLTEWVDRCGLHAHPVGVSAAEAFTAAQERFPAEGWAAHMFTQVWVGAALPDLRQLAETWPPDLVIHEEMDFAGLLLGRARAVADPNRDSDPTRGTIRRRSRADRTAVMTHFANGREGPRERHSCVFDPRAPRRNVSTLSCRRNSSGRALRHNQKPTNVCLVEPRDVLLELSLRRQCPPDLGLEDQSSLRRLYLYVGNAATGYVLLQSHLDELA